MGTVSSRIIPERSKVLVAMSGGVDSSVAASRLVNSGFDVVGVTMHLVSIDDKPLSGAQADDERACCSISASENARRVASDIGIPHYVLNLSEEFHEKVIDPSRKDYARGRTPNPCVLCNVHLKFDVLLKRAAQLGCDYVATGHYSRIIENDSGLHLLRGLDDSKDQSYFLSFLTDRELSKIIFPLGKDAKETVREEAKKLGLVSADRPESQDLCFFASGPSTTNSRDETSVGKSGQIATVNGEVVGTHSGIANFTIGQRKGIPGGMTEKMYVIKIDPDTGTVTIGVDADCYSSEFSLTDISLVNRSREFEKAGEDTEIQIRYRTQPMKGKLSTDGSGSGSVVLSEPVRAVTPGQVATFYDGDEVLGAGIIDVVGRVGEVS